MAFHFDLLARNKLTVLSLENLKAEEKIILLTHQMLFATKQTLFSNKLDWYNERMFYVNIILL